MELAINVRKHSALYLRIKVFYNDLICICCRKSISCNKKGYLSFRSDFNHILNCIFDTYICIYIYMYELYILNFTLDFEK